MRKLLACLTAAVVAFGISACSTPDPIGDKKILVYSGRSEALVKPVIEAFAKASGIQVDVRYGDSAAMAAQLIEEGDKTPAEVFFSQDAGALGAVAKQGLFMTLPSEVLGKVGEHYKARNGQWVGVTGRSRVMVYNRDQLTAETLPKSVFDLMRPEWKGRFAIAPTNASFQAFVTAIRVKEGDAKAKEFLAAMKSNAVIRENNVLIVGDVNDGKLAAGLVNHYYVYARAKEKGTTLDQLPAQLYYFPDGDLGALINCAGVGIVKKAESDPDVRAFVDYLLSIEGQTYFAQQTSEYPLISGVSAVAGLPALDSLKAPDIDLNDLDTLAATVAMIKDAGLA